MVSRIDDGPEGDPPSLTGEACKVGRRHYWNNTCSCGVHVLFTYDVPLTKEKKIII